MPVILADTGPIVAYLDRRDQHHRWALDQFSRLPAPYVTCEAVCVEAAHLLLRGGHNPAVVLELIQLGVLVVDFSVQQEVDTLRRLMESYRDRPMDLADACLVRLVELHADSTVLTVDADFQIYRQHRSQTIPVILPA